MSSVRQTTTMIFSLAVGFVALAASCSEAPDLRGGDARPRAGADGRVADTARLGEDGTPSADALDSDAAEAGDARSEDAAATDAGAGDALSQGDAGGVKDADNAGTAQPTFSAPPSIAPPSPKVADLLKYAVTIAWGGGANHKVTRLWQRNGSAAGTAATLSTAGFVAGDEIRVTVTATTTAGSASATSPAVTLASATTSSPSPLPCPAGMKALGKVGCYCHNCCDKRYLMMTQAQCTADPYCVPYSRVAYPELGCPLGRNPPLDKCIFDIDQWSLPNIPYYTQDADGMKKYCVVRGHW